MGLASVVKAFLTNHLPLFQNPMTAAISTSTKGLSSTSWYIHVIEKIRIIKNPLTIIAIFAAIAEISGTIVLPFIAETNQGTYLWFLMIFPVFLFLMFFLTLNFNHKVLYAPSDFKNEENFFRFFQPASPTEREDKLRTSVREIEAEMPEKTKLGLELHSPTEGVIESTIFQRDIRARYSLAEELVLNKIARELGQPVSQDMRFTTLGRNIVFDGVVFTNERAIAIEVRYFHDPRSITKRFKDVFHGILTAAEHLPDSIQGRFSIVLAVVTEAPTENHEQLSMHIYSLIGIMPIPIDVRVFSLDELEREFYHAA